MRDFANLSGSGGGGGRKGCEWCWCVERVTDLSKDTAQIAVFAVQNKQNDKKKRGIP